MRHPIDDVNFEDDIPTMRSKSLPRQPRKDLFLDEDLMMGMFIKRDRSPRFEGECSRNMRDSYIDRPYRSQRDFYVRDFMDPEDIKFEREFRLSRELRMKAEMESRENYEMDDYTNKRYRPV